MLREYDVVRLEAGSEAVPVPPGTEGTVLMIFPDTPPAYLVEFLDEAGESLGTFTLRDADLTKVPA
jgi:hypothetical protein